MKSIVQWLAALTPLTAPRRAALAPVVATRPRRRALHRWVWRVALR